MISVENLIDNLNAKTKGLPVVVENAGIFYNIDGVKVYEIDIDNRFVSISSQKMDVKEQDKNKKPEQLKEIIREETRSGMDMNEYELSYQCATGFNDEEVKNSLKRLCESGYAIVSKKDLEFMNDVIKNGRSDHDAVLSKLKEVNELVAEQRKMIESLLV